MEKTFIYGVDEVGQIADQVIDFFDQVAIITMEGSLGAGKTTFSKELLARLGVVDDVISPTFTYVNEYQGANGLRVYHFDLYRLSSESEFFELGFNEYLYQENSLVLIEWPEVIEDQLKEKVLRLSFDYEGVDKRSLKVVKD